ncbi:DUF853 family protein [Alicyclobacillaceae bacterium I2511]|nr:DUF853 family protein [Alicyclobacillaceae bacterium I2511]
MISRYHPIWADLFFVLILGGLMTRFSTHPWYVGSVIGCALLLRLGHLFTSPEDEENPAMLALYSFLMPVDKLGKAYVRLQRARGNTEAQPIYHIGILHKTGQALWGMYRMPDGESLVSLQAQLRELASVIGQDLEIAATSHPGYVKMTLGAPLPDQVSLGRIFKDLQKMSEPVWCIGQGSRGSVLPSLKSFPHLLVAGSTGGGKTNQLKVLAESLKVQGQDIPVVLVDLKGGGDYRNLRETVQEIIRDLPGLHAWLQTQVALLETRQAQAWETGETDFSPVVTLIDEFATVTTTASSKLDKAAADQAKEILSQVNTLLQKGRSLGIHLVLATQRPDAEVIPGILRANLDALVTFHVTTSVQSGVVLGPGRSEAYELPAHPGRAFVSLGGELTKVQTYRWEPLTQEKPKSTHP